MNYQILDGGVTPVQFKTLFTSAERIAIKKARFGDTSTTPITAPDEIIDDFMDIVDDIRCTTINLQVDSTKNALLYLVSLDILKMDRVEEILSAKVE